MRGSPFVGVDGLVLRPVVHEEALYLRHAPDEAEVAHQDPHLEEAREEVVEHGVAGGVHEKPGEEAGEDDEQGDAHEEAHRHRPPKRSLGDLLAPGELGAPRQGSVAHGKGVKEGHHPRRRGSLVQG